MLEVEMKFPAGDRAELEARLRDRSAVYRQTVHEEDHYHNAPDRDFAKTDEALRLRRIGTANFVTYKGPKTDALTKTRTEIEVAIAVGDDAAEQFLRLLSHLGYRPVTVVRKERKTYGLERHGFDVEICLDDVEGVGSYVELEIIAPDAQLAPARDALLELAAELGLSGSERKSYLQLLLEKRG